MFCIVPKKLINEIIVSVFLHMKESEYVISAWLCVPDFAWRGYCFSFISCFLFFDSFFGGAR